MITKPPPPADRVTDDRLLRKWGFGIVSRPKSGQPTWRLHDRVYKQADAVALAQMFEESK